MKDNNSKEIEEILLNNENYEKFLAKKIENEFNDILKVSENKKTQTITDISKLTEKELFSSKSTYLVINKSSKTKSYINGIQAEGFLGNQNILRSKFLNGQIDSFVSGDYYIKFCNYEK